MGRGETNTVEKTKKRKFVISKIPSDLNHPMLGATWAREGKFTDPQTMQADTGQD